MALPRMFGLSSSLSLSLSSSLSRLGGEGNCLRLAGGTYGDALEDLVVELAPSAGVGLLLKVALDASHAVNQNGAAKI